MKAFDVPVVAYGETLATPMAQAGFAPDADGVWRNAVGESFAHRLTGKAAPTFFVRVWGCQMNEHDAEAIAGQLATLGYAEASDESDADVVVLDTCAVRGTAADHVLGEVGRLKVLKAERPEMVLAVCGCLAQVPETVAYLRRHAPYVDLIFGTHNLHTLPSLLERVYRDEGQVVDVWRQAGAVVEGLPARRSPGIKAWVDVIYGCDKYCTYCIVPYTRGRERSRAPADVVREVERLAAEGRREITLLGQNVNSYGKDLEGGYTFARLLRDLDAVAGVHWLRYLTSHPRDFGDDLIAATASLEKVCEHYHLPVQSGSDEVLRWMNRGYTRAAYIDLIRRIRAAVPHAAITTDIIVGFPRESDEDFRATLDLLQEVGFDNAFMFAYSPRPGTPAARWEDPVPAEIKKERLKRLMEVQYGISLERNRALVGQTFEVLVEGPSRKDPAVCSARTRTNKLILIPDARARANTFATARVVAAHTWTLEGALVADA